MATSLAYLIKRVRLELGDEPHPFEASFFTDGLEFQYPLDHKPLKADSITVTRDGVPFYDWELDARHGVLLFDGAPEAGLTFFVAGIRYKYFNDDDMAVFVEDSVNEHTTNSVDIYGLSASLGTLPDAHTHPIAIRATILALWALVTDAAFDIDISAPDGVHIPRSERFNQLMGLINMRQGEYDAMAKALNIGMFRIEVFTLRRIAKRTNRLVPLYMTQEYDDARAPTRLYTEISTQGTAMPVEFATTIDLTLRKGSYFVHDITLGRDVSLVLKQGPLAAEVLLYPGQSVPRAKFAVTVLDTTKGSFRLEMDATASRFVPNTQSYWQLVVRGDKSTSGGVLLAQGKVLAERAISGAGGVLSGGINSSYLGG